MKITKKILCKYLSRMKLLMILIEDWHADKWKNTPPLFKWDQPGTRQMSNYCPTFYSRLKGGG
jgi:hypothetical protein